MASAVEPTHVGLSIEESVARLANHAHVLRELVHLSAGWLALEPRLEVKCALGDHLHDDASSVDDLRCRIEELDPSPGRPGAPGPTLAEWLDATHEPASPAAYVQDAYGRVKARLVAAIDAHLAAIDPVADAPSLRLLTAIRHAQERHMAELAPSARPVGPEGPGALPIKPGATRALRLLPPVVEPAREAYVDVAAQADPADPADPRALHAHMNAELCRAELAARTSHEHPDLPWALHLDLARQCWDDLRHAETYDRVMHRERGTRWGDFPVDLTAFTAPYALGLPDRLTALAAAPNVTTWAHVAADHARHARYLTRWRDQLT